MDFFYGLANQVGKIVDDIQETITDTVLEISANSDIDIFEQRSQNKINSSEIKEDLNEWTLLDDSENNFTERVVRVPETCTTYFWCDQVEFHGGWDSDTNKERFRSLLNQESINLEDLASYSFHYGIPFEFKLKVYKKILSNIEKNQRKFYSLKQRSMKSGIPKYILEDINEDMKFARNIELFAKMESLDIFQEVLFLLYTTHFKDQDYPQGLAYVCCPILFLLLQDQDNDLIETRKVIEKGATTQEEKIIKRKMIDFYLEKIQNTLFSVVSSFYQEKDSGLFEMHQSPLEFVVTINELLSQVAPELGIHLATKEIDLTSACFSWIVQFLVPNFQNLHYVIQLWDRYVVVLKKIGFFHSCVCVTILCHFQKELILMKETEDILKFFYNPPLADLKPNEFEKILQLSIEIAENGGIFMQCPNLMKISNNNNSNNNNNNSNNNDQIMTNNTNNVTTSSSYQPTTQTENTNTDPNNNTDSINTENNYITTDKTNITTD